MYKKAVTHHLGLQLREKKTKNKESKIPYTKERDVHVH